MLYLTCTTITSIELAHYGVSRATDWVSVDCGTIFVVVLICSSAYLPWFAHLYEEIIHNSGGQTMV